MQYAFFRILLIISFTFGTELIGVLLSTEQTALAAETDLTEQFLKDIKTPIQAAPSDTFLAAKKTRVIFVKGLFQHVIERIQLKYFGKKRLAFQEFREALDSINIPNTVASTNTIGSMWENARIISETIASEDGNVILVCHSKGCIDSLTFLTTPEFSQTAARVSGLISLGAPYFGAEYADLSLYYTSYLNGLDGEILEWLGGTELVAAELTTAYRQRYMNSQRDQIAELNKRIPILSVASNLLPTSGDKTHFATLGRLHRELYNLDNDGLVATKSAILPGSCYAVILNINHKDFLWDNEVMSAKQALNGYLKALENCKH